MEPKNLKNEDQLLSELEIREKGGVFHKNDPEEGTPETTATLPKSWLNDPEWFNNQNNTDEGNNI